MYANTGWKMYPELVTGKFCGKQNLQLGNNIQLCQYAGFPVSKGLKYMSMYVAH